MEKSTLDTMTSVSSVTQSIFGNCERVLDHVCETCGEKIFHVFNNKEGVEKIDFYTACDCVSKEWEKEGTERFYAGFKKNKSEIIKQNKAECGFGERDKDEASKSIVTHRGNINVYNRIIDYSNKFSDETEMGLYIFGQPGVGKSLFAKKSATIVLNKGYSVYFTNVAKLMAQIKKELGEYKRDRYDRCCSVDLLIIDDLGAEIKREYDVEQLFFIIEERINNKKPIIFTSNLSPDKLRTHYDEYGRIYSRIFGMCQLLEIKDNDNRIKEHDNEKYTY